MFLLLEALAAASKCDCGRCWASGSGSEGGGGDQGASLPVGSLTHHTPGRKVAELRGRWETDWPQVVP